MSTHTCTHTFTFHNILYQTCPSVTPMGSVLFAGQPLRPRGPDTLPHGKEVMKLSMKGTAEEPMEGLAGAAGIPQSVLCSA